MLRVLGSLLGSGDLGRLPQTISTQTWLRAPSRVGPPQLQLTSESPGWSAKNQIVGPIGQCSQ